MNLLLHLRAHPQRKQWMQPWDNRPLLISPLTHLSPFSSLKNDVYWFDGAALHCFEWEVPHTPQIFDHCQTCVGWVCDKHTLSRSTKSCLFTPTDDIELFYPHMQEAVCLRLNGSPEPGADRECPLWGSDSAHASISLAAWQGAEQTYRQTIEKSLWRSACTATRPPLFSPVPMPAGTP